MTAATFGRAVAAAASSRGTASCKHSGAVGEQGQERGKPLLSEQGFDPTRPGKAARGSPSPSLHHQGLPGTYHGRGVERADRGR